MSTKNKRRDFSSLKFTNFLKQFYNNFCFCFNGYAALQSKICSLLFSSIHGFLSFASKNHFFFGVFVCGDGKFDCGKSTALFNFMVFLFQVLMKSGGATAIHRRRNALSRKAKQVHLPIHL